MTVNTLALAVLAAAASAYGTVFEGTGLDFACLEACPCFDQEAINTATFTAAASQDYTELTALIAVFTDCSAPCAVTCSQAASAVCSEQTAINGWEFMDAVRVRAVAFSVSKVIETNDSLCAIKDGTSDNGKIIDDNGDASDIQSCVQN
eukprot:gene3979-25347_t